MGNHRSHLLHHKTELPCSILLVLDKLVDKCEDADVFVLNTTTPFRLFYVR